MAEQQEKLRDSIANAARFVERARQYSTITELKSSIWRISCLTLPLLHNGRTTRAALLPASLKNTISPMLILCPYRTVPKGTAGFCSSFHECLFLNRNEKLVSMAAARAKRPGSSPLFYCAIFAFRSAIIRSSAPSGNAPKLRRPRKGILSIIWRAISSETASFAASALSSAAGAIVSIN